MIPSFWPTPDPLDVEPSRGDLGEWISWFERQPPRVLCRLFPADGLCRTCAELDAMDWQGWRP